MSTREGSLSIIGGKERPGLVHRLDKDTTGILVVAKTDSVHRSLANQFKKHSISRVYEALVWGKPKSGEGRIDFSIGRDTKDRKKFSSRTKRPKESLTRYRVLQRFGKAAAHLELIPGTGRTHQLRVHLSAIGCPILGDHTYGGRKVMSVESAKIPRVMLHAKKLGFIHPDQKKEMEFTAPLPYDMKEIIENLKTATTPSGVDKGKSSAS